MSEGGISRYRCHTGHAYSINSLLAEVTAYVEDSLWNGMRAIEESMMLFQHLAKHMREQPDQDQQLGAQLEKRALEAEARANTVRKALMTHETSSDDRTKPKP